MIPVCLRRLGQPGGSRRFPVGHLRASRPLPGESRQFPAANSIDFLECRQDSRIQQVLVILLFRRLTCHSHYDFSFAVFVPFKRLHLLLLLFLLLPSPPLPLLSPPLTAII